jgi:hypothetical protein
VRVISPLPAGHPPCAVHAAEHRVNWFVIPGHLGSQQAQDWALIAGSTVDTFGLGRGLQTEGPPSVTGAMRRPARALQVPATPTPSTQSQRAPATRPAGTPLASGEAVIIDRQAMEVQASEGARPRISAHHLWSRI